MPEHCGIIKLESPLVKSMDERKISEVASRPAVPLTSLKPVVIEIFVDKILPRPYNPRQFKTFNEL
jgi:hypothetical protein